VIDLDVARRKFDREARSLEESRAALRERGIFIEEMEFPHIHALFSLPFALGRMVVFGARLGFEEYNLLPPSVLFVDPLSRRPLLRNELAVPGSIAGDLVSSAIVAAHPDTGFPFVCLRGFREYHTHPQHTDDPWEQYRYDGTTGTAYYCLEQIWLNMIVGANVTIAFSVMRGLPRAALPHAQ
jgi:hypothetical protein